MYLLLFLREGSSSTASSSALLAEAAFSPGSNFRFRPFFEDSCLLLLLLLLLPLGCSLPCLFRGDDADGCPWCCGLETPSAEDLFFWCCWLGCFRCCGWLLCLGGWCWVWLSFLGRSLVGCLGGGVLLLMAELLLIV